MAMLKSPAFQGANDVGEDLRSFIWNRLETMCVSQVSSYYYPRMMALHSLNGTEGMQDENGKVNLPGMLHLTCQSINSDGVYLLENGESLIMWIGRAVSPNFLERVFGVQSIDQLNLTTGEQML